MAIEDGLGEEEVAALVDAVTSEGDLSEKCIGWAIKHLANEHLAYLVAYEDNRLAAALRDRLNRTGRKDKAQDATMQDLVTWAGEQVTSSEAKLTAEGARALEQLKVLRSLLVEVAESP